MSGRVSSNSGVSEKVSSTFCDVSKNNQSEKCDSTSILSVLKVSKRVRKPLLDTFRTLKTLFETRVFTFDTFLVEKTQNVLDTFSDTPELPDTLLDSVLDTF